MMKRQEMIWKKTWVAIFLAGISAIAVLLCAMPLSVQALNAAVSQAASTQPSVNLSQIPAYSGKPYVKVHHNKPYFTKAERKRGIFEEYGQLDSKGRCTSAMAMISKYMMPTAERGAIGHVRPSAWHTVKYPDLIADRYLYNRCHLIGYQLTGENGNERNLITGTRYMNTEGMLPFENKVASYIRSTGHIVLYRVTPLFEGDNLLASGVLMEAKSIGKKGIRFCVFCYNVQPGIAIDYSNGESHVDEAYVAAHPEILVNSQGEPSSTASRNKDAGTSGPGNRNGGMTGKIPEGTAYVLNTNTRKFHYPTCSSVSDMAPKNTEYFKGSRDEAIARGFSPCGRCHP